MKKILFGLTVVWRSALFAHEYYDSGLIHYYEADAKAARVQVAEPQATREFIDSFFPETRDNAPLTWDEVQVQTDGTHSHRMYQLHFNDGGKKIPVLDHQLKTHYNRNGFLQYASSTYGTPLVLDTSTLTWEELKTKAEAEVWDRLFKEYKNYQGIVKLRPTLWVEEATGKTARAFDTEISWPEKGVYRRWIVKASDATTLEERRVIRFEHNPLRVTNKVYTVSPYGGAALASVTLSSLQDSVTLKNSNVYVRREKSAVTPTLIDVDPTVDYSAQGGFDTDPNNYLGLGCVSASITGCPNQAFDSVNTYYHLTSYRATLNTYYTDLGITSDVATKLTDPLKVIVNSLNIDVDGSGSGSDDTNNAAYIPQTCRTGAEEIPRCLIFLRPATVSTSSCTGTVATVGFYDLAREAVVAVHEFQHYITDRITSMVSGTTSAANVGDSLHEGYSDYFGASQISGLSGTTVTKVGEYAFQNCPAIIRDLATVRPFTNSGSESDPHVAGLSWASGLWKLRTETSQAIMDKIAIKSQFFLSTKPSFIEAVESLVKADIALYSGSHATRIRQLFYDEIKLGGIPSGMYRDSGNGVYEMGFRSCNHAIRREAPVPWASLLIFAVWLTVTLKLGKKWHPKKA